MINKDNIAARLTNGTTQALSQLLRCAKRDDFQGFIDIVSPSCSGSIHFGEIFVSHLVSITAVHTSRKRRYMVSVTEWGLTDNILIFLVYTDSMPFRIS